MKKEKYQQRQFFKNHLKQLRSMLNSKNATERSNSSQLAKNCQIVWLTKVLVYLFWMNIWVYTIGRQRCIFKKEIKIALRNIFVQWCIGLVYSRRDTMIRRISSYTEYCRRNLKHTHFYSEYMNSKTKR